MKKLLAVLILAASLISMVSCGGKVYEADAKEFTSNGLTITLTEAFVEKEQAGYTVCYDSKSVAVIVLKESFSQALRIGPLNTMQILSSLPIPRILPLTPQRLATIWLWNTPSLTPTPTLLITTILACIREATRFGWSNLLVT